MSQSGVTQPLHTLTATEVVQAIRHGHTTCAAVARACLEHIAVREPTVQAWQYLNLAIPRSLLRGYRLKGRV